MCPRVLLSISVVTGRRNLITNIPDRVPVTMVSPILGIVLLPSKVSNCLDIFVRIVRTIGVNIRLCKILSVRVFRTRSLLEQSAV